MNLVFNSQIVYSNQTISLTKTPQNQVYQITCISTDSNPDVNLTIYDTNSLIPLSTSSNSVLQNSCNTTTKLCRNILQIDFRFTDNIFDNMTSITCAVNSSNPQVPLTATISRNASVIIPRKYN